MGLDEHSHEVEQDPDYGAELHQTMVQEQVLGPMPVDSNSNQGHDNQRNDNQTCPNGKVANRGHPSQVAAWSRLRCARHEEAHDKQQDLTDAQDVGPQDHGVVF